MADRGEETVRGWRAAAAYRELRGAVSAATITLPVAIAYGLIIFAPMRFDYAQPAVMAGLYAAIFSAAVAAFLGGTPGQISGPNAAITLILAGLVASLAGGTSEAGPVFFSPESVACLVAVTVGMAGLFQVLAGLIRLGDLIKYVPQPVLAGFMDGVGILLIAGQAALLLGLDKSENLLTLVNLHSELQPWPALPGLVTLAAFFLCRRTADWIPAHLTALLAGTLAYHILAGMLPPQYPLGPLLDPVQAGPPPLGGWITLPDLINRPELMRLFPRLLSTALVIALIGGVETLLSSVISDRHTGRRHDSNRELLGQGLGNLASGLLGAIPVAGSASRTLVNLSAGGRGRLSAVLHSLVVLAAVFGLGPLFGQVPLGVIAGLVMAVGFTLIDPWSVSLVKKLLLPRGPRRELAVNLLVVALVAGATTILSITAAVWIGLVSSSLLFVYRMGGSLIRRRYSLAQVRSVRMRPIEHNQELTRTGKMVMIYELHGALFFGSADTLAREVEADMAGAKVCILDMKGISEIDSTGAMLLLHLHHKLSRQEQILALARISPGTAPWEALEAMEVIRAVGRHMIFPDVDAALEWSEEHLLSTYCMVDDTCQVVNLEQMDLTRDFSQHEFTLLASLILPEVIEPGTRIITEGDTDRDLYLLRRGTVSVRLALAGEGRSKRLMTYTPGVVFGEMALLDGRPRSADVWADTETEVYRLSQTDFQALSRTNPQLVTKIMLNLAKVISRRLRQTSEELRVMEEG